MKKTVFVVCLLLLVCMFTSAHASVYFNDFENTPIDGKDPGWTDLQGNSVGRISHPTVPWSGHEYYAFQGTQDPYHAGLPSITIVTGLTLGDFVLEADIFRMGSTNIGEDGGYHAFLARVQDVNNFLKFRVCGDMVNFQTIIGGSWGGTIASVRWSDNLDHANANAHITLTSTGQTLVGSAYLIDNPSVTATTQMSAESISFPDWWLTGGVGIYNSRPDNPGWWTGIDNFRVEFSGDVPGRLTGYITLEDWNMTNVACTPVKIELVPTSGGEAKTVVPVALDPSNINFNYTVNDIKPGTYNVYYSGSHWLRKLVSGVIVGAGNTVTNNVTLVSGDVDGDSEVTSTDLSVLLQNRNKNGD